MASYKQNLYEPVVHITKGPTTAHNEVLIGNLISFVNEYIAIALSPDVASLIVILIALRNPFYEPFCCVIMFV